MTWLVQLKISTPLYNFTSKGHHQKFEWRNLRLFEMYNMYRTTNVISHCTDGLYKNNMCRVDMIMVYLKPFLCMIEPQIPKEFGDAMTTRLSDKVKCLKFDVVHPRWHLSGTYFRIGLRNFPLWIFAPQNCYQFSVDEWLTLRKVPVRLERHQVIMYSLFLIKTSVWYATYGK